MAAPGHPAEKGERMRVPRGVGVRGLARRQLPLPLPLLLAAVLVLAGTAGAAQCTTLDGRIGISYGEPCVKQQGYSNCCAGLCCNGERCVRRNPDLSCPAPNPGAGGCLTASGLEGKGPGSPCSLGTPGTECCTGLCCDPKLRRCVADSADGTAC